MRRKQQRKRYLRFRRVLKGHVRCTRAEQAEFVEQHIKLMSVKV
jgi:hypothetical protein